MKDKSFKLRFVAFAAIIHSGDFTLQNQPQFPRKEAFVYTKVKVTIMPKIALGAAELAVNEQGKIIAITANDGTQMLSKAAINTPFLQLGVGGKMLSPVALRESDGIFSFSFENMISVELSYTQKVGYSVLTVTSLVGNPDVLVVGPIFSSLCEVIGDVIGVVQGGEYAIGIQALNAKTLGGFPTEYAQYINPMISKKAVSELSVDAMPYYESAAYLAEENGEKFSSLQLYCENRNRSRVKKMINYQGIDVAPMAKQADANIEGASFAIFCSPREDALNRIGEIELGEGLPHPMLDGEWLKTSRKAMQSYLIAEFDVNNVNELLEYTQKAGFACLYHPEPFEAWGHFDFRKDQFPEGDNSFAKCCEIAAKQGIRVGLHTLSAFTTTNDGYVSKSPDRRLVKLGGSKLTANIGKDDEVLAVGNTEPFKAVTSLQTIQIGNELISYKAIENGKLTGCKRGIYETTAEAHEKGEKAELLCDHPYRVFFPNLELQDEYSKRLAEIFTKTGVGQISFDGLEGCNATGEDEYSINRFCLNFWNKVGRVDLLNDASRLKHNLWHMHTHMNWGEPWGEKMREGMLEPRMKNQDFYTRNLFPHMLGWFLIRKADRKFEATTPEDIEWALSMAAGFDSGFALSTSKAVLDMNGCTNELFEAIKNWEQLRLEGKFPAELRKKLCKPETEWHLEKSENGKLSLYPIAVSKAFVCDLLELQPGQPGGSDWSYSNPFSAQSFDFRMRVEGNGEIIDPSLITAKGMIKFECRIKGGQYLWYRNGKAVITDRNFRPIGNAAQSGEGIVEAGQQPLSFSCGFEGEEGPEVTVTVFTKGEVILI